MAAFVVVLIGTPAYVGIATRRRMAMHTHARRYLDRRLTDDWGTALAFTCTTTTDALVVSAGPDRTFGTRDDIRSDRE